MRVFILPRDWTLHCSYIVASQNRTDDAPYASAQILNYGQQLVHQQAWHNCQPTKWSAAQLCHSSVTAQKKTAFSFPDAPVVWNISIYVRGPFILFLPVLFVTKTRQISVIVNEYRLLQKWCHVLQYGRVSDCMIPRLLLRLHWNCWKLK